MPAACLPSGLLRDLVESVPMSKEVPFTAERENGNNRWTDVASVSIGCAVPMVVFGRASIVPFVALPVIIGLCRSDTGFFRMIQEAIRRHRFLVMAVAATILLWLISSVASIDPVKSLSTWARTTAILALGVMLTAFLSQSKRRVDLALKSLTISSFGLLLFYAVFSPIFTLRLSNSSVSSRVRTPSHCRLSNHIFRSLLHSAHCRMGRVSPRLVPQMDRALQHTTNFPAYLR